MNSKKLFSFFKQLWAFLGLINKNKLIFQIVNFKNNLSNETFRYILSLLLGALALSYFLQVGLTVYNTPVSYWFQFQKTQPIHRSVWYLIMNPHWHLQEQYQLQLNFDSRFFSEIIEDDIRNNCTREDIRNLLLRSENDPVSLSYYELMKLEYIKSNGLDISVQRLKPWEKYLEGENKDLLYTDRLPVWQKEDEAFRRYDFNRYYKHISPQQRQHDQFWYFYRR